MKIRALIILLIAMVMIVAPVHAKKKNQKELPPGLQKKVERGDSLPPGWHKKLAKGKIIDRDIYKRGSIVAPSDPRGVVTIRIEDKFFRVIENTREILEILDR